MQTKKRRFLFPTLEIANKYELEDLKELVSRIIQSNEFLQEEIIICEQYINKNASILSQKAPHSDIDSLSEYSVGSMRSSNSDLNRAKPKRQLKKRFSEQEIEISLEHKLEICTNEIDYLRKKIEEERKECEKKLEMMKAQIKEADIEIEEIDKESYEFRRDIVIGGINPRTGKVIAEKVKKYFEDKIKFKNGLIEKLKLKTNSLKSQNLKAKKQLAQREEMGEGLSKIDFDQLKIENDQLQQQIDEKNNELVRLKLSTGKTVQILTALMDKLTKLTCHTQWLKKQIDSHEDELERVKKEIERVLQEKEKIEQTHINLLQQQESMKVPDILEYVKLKSTLHQLEKDVQNWKRKCDIATANEKIRRMALIKMRKI